MVFIRVVQEGSFSAAARALRLPKTTVSRKVRELEEQLGVQLLQRTTRRLGLTEAGTVYFQHCRRIAPMLAEAEAAVGQLQGEPRGWLRLTSSHSLLAGLISPLLGDFRALYPQVRIDLSVTHHTLDLIAGEIDVALRTGPLPDSSMAARRLAVFPNRLYASRTYLARHGEPTHPDQLPSHPALATRLARRGDGYAWPMRDGDGGALRDYPIDPVVVADDPQALKGPLFAGEGLMMATDMIMRDAVAEGLVQPILAGWTGRCPALNAVFPRGHIQPPKVRVFIDFLVSRLDLAGYAP
jgi:DNA-binding transcriptional LysR family regulator